MARSLKYCDLSFIVIIVFVVGGLQLLARVNRSPEIPRDSAHSSASADARGQCLLCHRRNSQSQTELFDQAHKRPKSSRANKNDCLLCHRNAAR